MDVVKWRSLCNSTYAELDTITEEFISIDKLRYVYSRIRMGGLSRPQIEEAMKYVCIDEEECYISELFDVLRELDRRYYIVQDYQWQFSLLDTEKKNCIPEESAKWLVNKAHKDLFSEKEWGTFLGKRLAPGYDVTFPEIEVMICNIPSIENKIANNEEMLRAEKELQEKENAAEEKRKKENATEEKRKKEFQIKEALREEQAQLELIRLKEMEELQRKEQERERQEHEKANEIAFELEKAKIEKAEADEEQKMAKELLSTATDAEQKKDAEERIYKAEKRAKEIKDSQIRLNLKNALKSRDFMSLPNAIMDFENAKLSDNDRDLSNSKVLLKLFQIKEELLAATDKRILKDLESSIAKVKKNQFEGTLASEMIEANKVLLQLRKLERIRAEILELKQSTVAEIRSYSQPPLAVHEVMIATFLNLGHKEKETKEWNNVKALVGKTGKEGLKRRCLECKPELIADTNADKANALLQKYSLDEVRDVSAGAATFYLWSMSMFEEHKASPRTFNQSKNMPPTDIKVRKGSLKELGGS